MKTYKHLSLLEREKFFGWKEKGLSIRTIAKYLNRSPSTLSRELKRHTKCGKEYLPCLSERRARKWGEKQRHQAPLKNTQIFLYVREHLRLRWSPETIAGRLSIDCPGNTIDDDTIYRYVYGNRQRRMKLWRYLTLHRKRRMKKYGRKVKTLGRLIEASPIEKRPQAALQRKEPGHWESDNMEGLRSNKKAISVTVERVIKITRIRSLVNHKAETKAAALVKQFKEEKEAFKKTITFDRGTENSDHQTITRETGIPTYFCNPYRSWEKGTVENTIGRIRRHIPKGISIDNIDEKYLLGLEDYLNNTPRKCLNFLTPNEAYAKMQKASNIP